MAEWTEGVCGDGAAILRDGAMIPIEDLVASLNNADRRIKQLEVVAWAAWNELNAIRARDGVPYTHAGWKSDVDEVYFSQIVDALSNALGEDAMPWPAKRWLEQDGTLPFVK
jgi:hypothetical protein